MIGVGIMSGSSLDGLDVVAVTFSEEEEKLKWNVEATETIALPESISKALSEIVQSTAVDVLKIESQFSKFIAQSITNFCNRNKLSPAYVSIHGHTVAHLPEHYISWQLLNGGMVAALSSYPVVCDFRNADMALGGQGTPMAVLADRDLYPGYDYYINLGGIANVSHVQDGEWRAYDLFPFNQVFNHFSRSLAYDYDKGGQIAATGQIQQALLDQLHAESYINKPAPKSIDNNWVKNYWIKRISDFELSAADAMRTYVEFVSENLSQFISPSDTVLWSGGGVHNDFFMKSVEAKGVCAEVPDTMIIDFKEAILIAYAGYLRMHGKSNFVSSATGASADTIGGAVYLAQA